VSERGEREKRLEHSAARMKPLAHEKGRGLVDLAVEIDGSRHLARLRRHIRDGISCGSGLCW